MYLDARTWNGVQQGWTLLLIALTLCCLVQPVVPQPPQIIEHPEKEYGYREGSTGFSVTLPCRARGQPEPAYHWTKNGQPLSTDSIKIKMLMGEGTIIIERPAKDDAGVYQCFAQNEYGIALSSRAVLRKAFLDPFSFTTSTPRQHKPEVGKYLRLKCSPPKSYPEGHIYWSQAGGAGKGAKKNLPTNDRVTIDYEGNLYFANIILNDSLPNRDAYVCSIHNGDIKGTMDGDVQILQVVPLSDQGNLHFANVLPSDGQDDTIYVCVISNSDIRGEYQGADQMVKPLQVSVTPPFRAPSLRWSSHNPAVAIKGTEHRMKCIFSGYPTPSVRWERLGGKEMPASHSIHDHGMELRLQHVEWADAGMYRCVATTPNMPNSLPISRDFELTVESAPYFIREMRDITASEEEDAEFECDASGVPTPTVEWSLNGMPIGESDNNPRRTVDGSIVIYKNLTKADSQVLQCNASNKHGYIFKNVYLNVLAEAPSFIRAPEPVLKVAEGQNINLTCQVFGHPRPRISWLKENKAISDPRVSLKQDDEGETNGGNLTIKGVMKSDEGLYTCQAVNKFGNGSESGRLIVREPTVISMPPEDTTVNATEDVTLHCEATTDAHEQAFLEITWLRNREAIIYENEPRISKNNQDNSLIISVVTVDDTDEYTCVATNGLDTDERTVHVTVKDRPDPPKNVRLRSCVLSAEIEWEPGNENNEEVIEYIIYYNTSFDEPDTFTKAKTAARGATSARIDLSPWANYTFHVKARNNLGVSDRSNFTSARCENQPQIPFKNPDNVCTDSGESNELVITWDIMPRIDHNGPGFHYLVHWRRLDIENMAPNTEQVMDWQQGRYVVTGQETFKEYEIYVQAVNNQGPSPATTIKKMIGYSGEGTPKDSPSGFSLDEDSLNATSAIFTWEPVDESPDNIRGHFIGYEVVYWRVDQPDDKRTHLVELNEAVNCRPAEGRRRARRQASGDEVTAHVLDLWPYSTIVAGVSVRNGKSSGQLSPTIEFTTPQGVPSIVPMFEVRERGSHHFGVAWEPPLEPNGIITGYIVGWQKSDALDEEMQTKEILDPFKHSSVIKNLKDTQEYRLHIWAMTEAGRGKMLVIEDRTLEAGSPDKPGFANIEIGEQSVNVSWVPTDEEEQRKNPGSEFYVEYRKADSDDEWLSSEPLEEDHQWTNISGLDFGDEYEIRIVAVNGAGQETRSDPKRVQVGQKAEKQVMSIARAGWFVGMMCAIAFLLLVLIIVCLIKRNRGGKYPVHEKEKLRGRDPDRDDEERGFGEYTKTDEPDYKKSAGSLESESKPLEMSDSDSMAEYEDTDPSKFNEDGSFIGQYGGKKTKSKDKIEPDATSPSALSTFV